MITTINNKHKKLNVPNLRFPEFQGEWVRMRLDAFTERVMRKNKNNKSKLPLTISAQYGLVDQITFFNKVIASTDMSNYYLLKKGEFAYNKSYSSDYPWGAVKRLDNYEQGALSSLYICFAPKDNVVSDFILQYFESPKWHKGVSEIAVEGARNHGLLNVSVQDFFHTYHYVPKDKKEQIKVAELLMLLDERIATQNKIIEDLKKLKSAISKKLLCNDKWTTCIIQDIAKIGRGRVISSVEIDRQKHPLYPVYSSQTSNNGIMGYLDNYMFDGEYITWTTDGANAGTVFYRKGKFNCTNVCGTLKILPKFDCYFVSLVLQQATQKYVSSNLANPKLMNNTMASIKIRMPNIETQKQLSKVFQTLDSCLLVHQRTCKMYLSEKQYLLRQMFI